MRDTWGGVSDRVLLPALGQRGIVGRWRQVLRRALVLRALKALPIAASRPLLSPPPPRRTPPASAWELASSQYAEPSLRTC